MSGLRIQFLIYLLSIVALGCSTTGVSVQTRPEPAEAFLYNSNGTKTSLGQTPVTISPEQIRRVDGNLLRVGIEKQGFVKEHIYINKVNFGLNGTVDVEMTPLANWNRVYQDDQASKYLSEVAQMAAQVQGATLQRDFSKAEILAKSMVDRYPKLDVAWSLLGNIYYLQKRASDALEAYNKAFLLNPSSVETKNMINKLKGIDF
ncbi:MAG: tetratricopeptide repeat protein [Bdellovibrionales bacterium]